MRRLTTISALVAMLAIAGGAAATASAEEGFLPLTSKELTWSSGNLALESTGGWSYLCKSSEGKGTFASDKHFTIELHFNGCTSLGLAMNSLGDSSGLVLFTALALVCLINSKELVFGVFIELPAAGVHVETPAAGALLLLVGTYIGEITTKGKGKSFTVALTGKAGKQNITECEGKKASLTSENNENNKPEGASVNMEALSLNFPGERELMDV